MRGWRLAIWAGLAMSVATPAWAQVVVGFPEPPKPEAVAPPFSLMSSWPTACADQLKVCAIAEVVGTPVTAALPVTYYSDPNAVPLRIVRSPQSSLGAETFIQFTIRVVDGVGVKAGEVYTCLSRGTQPVAVGPHPNRYLILGWSALPTGELNLEFTQPGSSSRSSSIHVDRQSMYVSAFLPTRQPTCLKAADARETAYLNLAEILRHPCVPAALRQATDALLALCRQDPNSGLDAHAVFKKLASAPQHTALERYRIGGILATWNPRKYGASFIRSLASTMDELNVLGGTPTGETGFIWQRSGFVLPTDGPWLNAINPFKGVDPDIVFQQIERCPALRLLAVDRRVGKPSLKYQRTLLPLLESKSMRIREFAYQQLALWYGETDKWVTFAPPSHAGDADPREPGLRSYWEAKLGGK